MVIGRAPKQRIERKAKQAAEEEARMGPRMKRLNEQMIALSHEIALEGGISLDEPEGIMHSHINCILHREDAHVHRHKAKARAAASKTSALVVVASVQRSVEPPSLIDPSLLPTPTLTPTPTPPPPPPPAAGGSPGDARDGAKHGSGSPGSTRTPQRPAGTSSPDTGADSPRSRVAKTSPRLGRAQHAAATAAANPKFAPPSGAASPTCVADFHAGGDAPPPHDGAPRPRFAVDLRLAARRQFDAEVEHRRKTAEHEAARARVKSACAAARDLRKQLRTPIEKGGCAFKPSRAFQGNYTRPEKALIVV